MKWTSSEPIQSKKFNRLDKGDVAHLGSENVILKGYQPLSEYSILPRFHRGRIENDSCSKPEENSNVENYP